MASVPRFFRLVMILFMARFRIGEAKNHDSLCEKPRIKRGYKLSANSNQTWSSPSNYFHFGFHQEGNGFAIGIWLQSSKQSTVSSPQKTVVWTANRDDPPVGSNSTLEFTDRGELVLKIFEHEKLRERKLMAGKKAASASLLDSGNFVLCGDDSSVLWESFEYPTDTLLPGQDLPAGEELVASSSDNDHSYGKFHLLMQEDRNIVLYPLDSANSYEDLYWATDTPAPLSGLHVFHLSLNSSTGVLYIVNTTSSEKYKELNSKANVDVKDYDVIFRATVDYDGNFRVYAHTMPQKKKKEEKNDNSTNDESQVSMVWQAVEKPCSVRGLCGFNRFCTLYDGKPNCFCVPGTEDNGDNTGNRLLGCVRNYTRKACRLDGKENMELYRMAKMENMISTDSPYTVLQTSSAEECRDNCLEDCNCEAVVFDSMSCRKQKLPLKYVSRDFDQSVTVFFKVGKGEEDLKNGKNLVDSYIRKQLELANRRNLTRIFALVFGFILLSCVALVVVAFFAIKIRILRYQRLRDDGALDTDGHGLLLKVFSYEDLKLATNRFKDELGKGSFGAVYKGSLNKGRKLIAVKMLERFVQEGEKEFRAEMRAIGRTNHKNLVRLLGYCAEGSKRLLVYEYMSNGSLANHLFEKESRVDWNERVRYATDIAKGILYLHEGCRNPIIHCDIKPQNILMDEFWTAKISDFGLAKFLMADQTRTMTVVRGTRGYMAPEWSKNSAISVKADVYGYGIVLLEIMCCRRNLEDKEIELTSLAYKCFSDKKLNELVKDEEVDRKKFENMVKVALWCIQDPPERRPSMKSVVLMLEGITKVADPPCPTSPLTAKEAES